MIPTIQLDTPESSYDHAGRPPLERAHDVLKQARRNPLEALFAPRTIASKLLRMLVQLGRDEKLDRIIATILPDNREMQHVCRKAGFEIKHNDGEPECKAEIRL